METRNQARPCGLGSRIRDVEAFWYKTEIKIIYFVQLCLIALIVCDCMVYPDPKFLIFKTKKHPQFFYEAGGWFFFDLNVIMQDICNKFIEINFCLWCSNIEHLSNIDEITALCPPKCACCALHYVIKIAQHRTYIQWLWLVLSTTMFCLLFFATETLRKIFFFC